LIEFPEQHRGLRHIDIAVAVEAAETGFDMAFVREIDEIGQVVYLFPGNWRFCSPVGKYFIDFALLPLIAAFDDHVTAHTGLNGRYPCHVRSAGVDMTEFAGDHVVVNVGLMAEIDRLLYLLSFRYPRLKGKRAQQNSAR